MTAQVSVPAQGMYSTRALSLCACMHILCAFAYPEACRAAAVRHAVSTPRAILSYRALSHGGGRKSTTTGKIVGVRQASRLQFGLLSLVLTMQNDQNAAGGFIIGQRIDLVRRALTSIRLTSSDHFPGLLAAHSVPIPNCKAQRCGIGSTEPMPVHSAIRRIDFVHRPFSGHLPGQIATESTAPRGLCSTYAYFGSVPVWKGVSLDHTAYY